MVCSCRSAKFKPLYVDRIRKDVALVDSCMVRYYGVSEKGGPKIYDATPTRLLHHLVHRSMIYRIDTLISFFDFDSSMQAAYECIFIPDQQYTSKELSKPNARPLFWDNRNIELDIFICNDVEGRKKLEQELRRLSWDKAEKSILFRPYQNTLYVYASFVPDSIDWRKLRTCSIRE